MKKPACFPVAILFVAILLFTSTITSAVTKKQWRKYRDEAREAVKRNDFERALELYSLAFKEAEAAFKGGDIRFLDTTGEAAQLHIQLRKYPPAIDMINKAISRMPKPTFHEVNYSAALMNLLGSTQLYAQDLDAAAETFRIARDFSQRKLGDRHFFVAEALQGLGAVQIERKQLEDALRTLQQALDITQDPAGVHRVNYSPDAHFAHLRGQNPVEGGIHNMIGVLHVSTSNYNSAEKSFRDALKCFSRMSGNNNANIAAANGNLATALAGQHKYMEAEDVLIKVLAIAEDSKGSALLVLQTCAKLAALHEQQDEKQLDSFLQRLAAGKFQETEARNFPFYLEAMARYHSTKDSEHARRFLDRAIKVAPEQRDEIERIRGLIDKDWRQQNEDES
jgi:tetratricopeptide (TPR) repeat protein